jgi:hypothetical protein
VYVDGWLKRYLERMAKESKKGCESGAKGEEKDI